MKNIIAVFFFGFSLFLITSCGDEAKDNQKEIPSIVKKRVKVPKFNRDSAYLFVQKQVDFGPRVPGTLQHTNCKDWIVSKLKSYGAVMIEQSFEAKIHTGTSYQGTNIIAQFNPSMSKRVVLSAHWDTRFMAEKDEKQKDKPIDGADDGGSGVGILIEIARLIHLNPIDMGVDIVLFDVEDQGQTNGGAGSEKTWCIGAQYWATNLHRPNYKPDYGILLDMVGSKGAVFPKEANSRANAGRIIRKIWPLAKNMGFGNFFVNRNEQPVTDDHYFVMEKAKFPMVDIINYPGSPTGFGHYHHTQKDNMSIIDKKTLRAVGQVITAVIYQESGGNL